MKKLVLSLIFGFAGCGVILSHGAFSFAMASNDAGCKVVVEVQPKFPGGDEALAKWVRNHIKYPKAAQENGIQGTVVVCFEVLEDGSVGEVKIMHSVDALLDKEAIRVVKSLPRFTPGTQDGKPVKVLYTIPVRFRLM